MKTTVSVLKQIMFEDEARDIAERKNDWFWNMIFRSKKLSRLSLYYMEYVLFDLETTSAKNLLSRILNREYTPVKKKMQILVNGTTGSVALVTDRMLQLEDVDFDENTIFQNASFDEEEAIKRAKMLAHKITHRAMGGMHEAEIVQYMSIYRPFWVAFYGDYEAGSKVRYITIPADGGRSSRAR